MLPFARMVKFGNIREVTKIRKMVTDGTSGILFLTTSGKLYAAGPNTNGKFGDVTTSADKWTLIYENVDDFYYSPTWTFLKLKDGQYMCSGETTAFGYPTSNIFVNCSSIFNAVTGTIIDVQVNALRNCIGVLTNLGELWFIGTNTQYIFGMSTPSSSTSFVKNTIVSDVKSFKLMYANVWALTNSGVLYGSGNPNASQIPSSTGFTQIATGVLGYSATVAVVVLNTASGVFARGNVNNKYGTSVSGATATLVSCSLPFTYNAATFAFPKIVYNSSSVAAKIIIQNGTDYYVSAVSDNYGFTSTNASFTPGPVPAFTKMINAPTSIEPIFFDSTYSSYYIENDICYVAGRLFPIPSYTTSDKALIYTEEKIVI